MKKVIAIIVAVGLFALLYQSLDAGGAVRLQVVHIEDKPGVYTVPVGKDTGTLWRGAHFNVFPGPSGWDMERSEQAIRDMAAHGFTSVLFFTDIGGMHHPNLERLIVVATGLGMRVIVRVNIKHFTGLVDGSDQGAYYQIAQGIDHLNQNFGVTMFQIENEADAVGDWDIAAYCANPALAYRAPFLAYDYYCPGGDPIHVATGLLSMQPAGDPPINPYYMLGNFAASELHELMRRLYRVHNQETGGWGFAPPPVQFIIPPVATGDLENIAYYYRGFFQYWVSNRLGAWGMWVGGTSTGELPAIVTPIISLHVYSPLGVDNFCSLSPQTITENVYDVIHTSLTRRAAIQAAVANTAYQEAGHNDFRIPIRHFIMTEAGPSPEVLWDLCGPDLVASQEFGKLRAIWWAWVEAYDSLCSNPPPELEELGSCLPMNFWLANMYGLDTATNAWHGETDRWELITLYPEALCRDAEDPDRVLPDGCLLP